MTWLLVRTRPDPPMTMPVAAAVPPWKPRLLVMSTRPGETALTTDWMVALLAPGPAPLPPRPLPRPPEGFEPRNGLPDADGVEPFWWSTSRTVPAPAAAATAATAM